jgi:hypothetical protein
LGFVKCVCMFGFCNVRVCVYEDLVICDYGYARVFNVIVSVCVFYIASVCVLGFPNVYLYVYVF